MTLGEGISKARSRSNSLVPGMVMAACLDNKEIQENQSEQTLQNFDSIKIIDDAQAASTDIPAISVNDEKQED